MPEIEVGIRIREKRKVKHYTRDVLANKVGISSKFLYEIETGRKNFSAVILRKIAQELDVSCDYIMMGEKAGYEAVQFLKRLEALGAEKLARLQKLLDVLEGMCDMGDNSSDDNNNAGDNNSSDDSDNVGDNNSSDDNDYDNKKV